MSKIKLKVKMQKQLGLIEGVGLILGIIFGSGIFISPRAVLEKTGSVWGSIVVWSACGGLATIGALSYAELGTTLAKSGGDYHYINEAYGPLLAFLYLWDSNFVFVFIGTANVLALYWTIITIAYTYLSHCGVSRPCSNAIMAATFANNVLFPVYETCPIDPNARKLIAASTILLFIFINAYDIKFSTRLQIFFAFIMLSALVIIVIGGVVWISKGRLENFKDGWAGTKASIGDWAVAFFVGIFSYSGWNYLNFMIEELKNPFVNLPRAIYISLPIVTFIYITVNISYLAVLGMDVLHTEAIAVHFAKEALGWMYWIMPALVAIATLGGLSVNIMASSRMCFAGARNGHMPELLAHINIHCMSPMPSLVFQMLISLLMLIPDNLTTLITYCTIVESFFNTISCSAVLWLRYKKPHLHRPIKVQLWMPITFVVVTVLLSVVPAFSEPIAVLSGALITLAGLPVFYCLVVRTSKKLQRISVKITHICQKLFLSAIEEDEE